ncbi:chloramphenicol acetyltransferase [Tenacibaculum sp. MAR_2009_124]|uniref:chloramphenicol acetyltransferase n=1 Tax=Tenacibaculum sp. MAR_2009_124 TaxID=1250059 RepID=UPI000B852C36|nr:chloramphenicol acetyltransferase [Tenacibaculum sp. MAR_2009_124]
MKTKIDIDTWNRKEVFNFFKDFNEPFYGLTVDIDCTIAYDFCKKNNISFFLFYLHRSLLAANKIENFKYRIIGGEVYVYDKVNASPTINRPNGTFGFSYMSYHQEFSEFEKEAKLEIERVQATNTLIPATSGENVIHYSSIPWIKFTSLSHARHFEFEDSCPKITFGKMTDRGSKKEMPMSVHAHHALLDGSHIGQYIDLFQEFLNNTSI